MENNNRSKYVQSLMNPRKYQTYYPDYDQTTSHLKSITLTNNIEVMLSGFLLIHRPLNPNNNNLLALYVPDAVQGGYTFCKYIRPDEDLSLNYSRARLVSGGLRVISTTISPSVTFSVSGVIAAADVQTLPNTRELNYSQIISYRRNPVDVVTCSVATGVVSLSHPEGQNRFRILESGSSENTDNILKLSYNYQTGTQATAQGWNFAAGLWKTYSVAAGTLPSDITGLVNLVFAVEQVTPGQSTNLRVTTLRKSEIDWVTDVLTTFDSVLCTDSSIGSPIVLEVYAEDPIDSIQVYGQPTVVGNIGKVQLSIVSTEYYQLGVREPCTLIGVDGVTPFSAPIPGTVMTCSGIYNYESVPDAELARQLTTTTKRDPESVFVIPATMNLINSHELKFLWPLNQYDFQMESMSERVSATPVIAEASGLLDILKSIGKSLVPVVSGVASTISPILGDVVRGIGDTAFSSGLYRGQSAGLIQSSRYNPPRRGFTSKVEDPEFVKSFNNSQVKTTPYEVIGETLGVPVPDIKKVKVGKNFSSIVASSTKANLLSAMARGVVSQLSFEFIGNRFPVIIQDAASHGIVYFSALPFDGRTYQQLDYVVVDNDRNINGALYISTGNTTFDPEAAFGICAAHASARQPKGFLTYDVDVNALEGSSLSLASYASMMRKSACALITGAILPDRLNVFMPSKLVKKITYAKNVGLPLIVPGGDLEYKELIEAMESTRRFIVGDGDLEAGDVTYSGYYPGVYMAGTLASFTLSMLFCIGDKTNAWNVVPDFTIEEIIVTDPITEKETVAYRPAQPAKMQVSPDLNWAEIADEVEAIGTYAFSENILTPNALAALSNGNLNVKDAQSLYNTYSTLTVSRDETRRSRLEDLQALGFENWDEVIPEYEKLKGTSAAITMKGRDNPLLRWQAYPMLGMIKAARTHLTRGGSTAKRTSVAPKVSIVSRASVIGKAIGSQARVPAGAKMERRKSQNNERLQAMKAAPQGVKNAPKVAPTKARFIPQASENSLFDDEPEEAEELFRSDEEDDVPEPQERVRSNNSPQAQGPTEFEKQMMAMMQNMNTQFNTLKNQVDTLSGGAATRPTQKNRFKEDD